MVFLGNWRWLSFRHTLPTPRESVMDAGLAFTTPHLQNGVVFSPIDNVGRQAQVLWWISITLFGEGDESFTLSSHGWCWGDAISGSMGHQAKKYAISFHRHPWARFSSHLLSFILFLAGKRLSLVYGWFDFSVVMYSFTFSLHSSAWDGKSRHSTDICSVNFH